MDPLTVAERLAQVRDRIGAAGRAPDEITIVAVTKALGPEAVAAAVAAGIRDIGENYAQELIDKHRSFVGPDADADTNADTDAAAGPGDVRWHFLGAVQRNKVSRLAGAVDLWQSVDRVAAGEEIARRSSGAAVLLQVNLTGEPQRLGCAWEQAPRTVDELRALDLDVRGVMGVATQHDEDAARKQFARLADLAARTGLREVSMGMSDDLELAVEEGATIVRVGRALFGPRPGPPEVRR